jgi:hypothetical protein
MSEAVLRRVRAAVIAGAYDMTQHAVEEMAEDALTVVDVESALLTATLVRTETDDPRGTCYVLEGMAEDGGTLVGVVLRFNRAERPLIITVYEVME